VLAYSVRAAGDLAYREKISALASDELFAPHGSKLRFAPVVTRKQVPGTLGRRLTRLIADGDLERFAGLPLDPERARLLVCGNPLFLDDLREVLSERGLRPDRGRDPGHFACENYW
jgi:ferredoxin--NADP+ reductase